MGRSLLNVPHPFLLEQLEELVTVLAGSAEVQAALRWVEIAPEELVADLRRELVDARAAGAAARASRGARQDAAGARKAWKAEVKAWAREVRELVTARPGVADAAEVRRHLPHKIGQNLAPSVDAVKLAVGALAKGGREPGGAAVTTLLRQGAALVRAADALQRAAPTRGADGSLTASRARLQDQIRRVRAAWDLARRATVLPELDLGVLEAWLASRPPPRPRRSAFRAGTRESLPGTRESLPGTRESLPGTRESLPGTRESLPGTRESLPGTRESDPGT